MFNSFTHILHHAPVPPLSSHQYPISCPFELIFYNYTFLKNLWGIIFLGKEISSEKNSVKSPLMAPLFYF